MWVPVMNFVFPNPLCQGQMAHIAVANDSCFELVVPHVPSMGSDTVNATW